MRIPFERFRQSVGGALDVREEDGWICPRRFSAAASNALRGVNDFARKSYGTAGICLRFRTDAGRLSFHYRLRKAAPYRGAWFDVLENGARTAHFGQIFGFADGWQEGTAEIVLTAGMKTDWSK